MSKFYVIKRRGVEVRKRSYEQKGPLVISIRGQTLHPVPQSTVTSIQRGEISLDHWVYRDSKYHLTTGFTEGQSSQGTPGTKCVRLYLRDKNSDLIVKILLMKFLPSMEESISVILYLHELHKV